jgi:hypothetical protein
LTFDFIISQILGRKEGYVIALVLYVVGYIIVASSPDIYAYGVGNSIYVLGITGELYRISCVLILSATESVATSKDYTCFRLSLLLISVP